MAGKKKDTEKSTQISDKSEKLKALAATVSQLEKEYGKGTIVKMSDKPQLDVSAISTGSVGIDLALGIGGLPRGRVTEIYGPESSGKTTIALSCVAQAQKAGGTAAYIDVENALDPVYAKNIGVDTDELLVSQPESGEQALDICDALVSSGAVDIVVIDSVAALVPQQEIEGDMGAATVGVQARMMSKALRKLTGTISKTNTIVIFINQLRQKIGVMYGNPETTTGGTALKFYASVRLDIRKKETLKQGGEAYGNRVCCKVVKNKVAPPFKQAEFDILYGKGISKASELVDMGVKTGVIDKSGSFFYYNEERLAQGRENAVFVIEKNEELMAEIEEKVKAKMLAAAEDGEMDIPDDDDDLDLRELEMELEED